MSSTFFPNAKASLYKTASYDETGRATMAAPVLLLVAPVRIRFGKKATSIRADKSGSKSYAEEQDNYSRILVHPRIGKVIEEGDEIEYVSHRFEVKLVQPRFDIDGRLHHYEVDML